MPANPVSFVSEKSVAITAAQTLHEHGYAATAAMYPTVRLGQAMIRLAISATHRDEDIRGVAEVLNNITDSRAGIIHG